MKNSNDLSLGDDSRLSYDTSFPGNEVVIVKKIK